MIMKKWLSKISVATFLVLSLAPFVSAQQLVFKYGHVAPPGNVMFKASNFLKTYVEEKTKGAMKIEVYPSGQLGGERALLDGVLAGTLNMANVGAPILSTVVPEANVFCLPYVIPNEDVFWRIVNDKEFREKFFSLLRKKGLEPIGFIDGCGRGFLNKKRPVRRPEDIRGLTIRVMEGPIYTDMFRALGANTRTIPFPELYTALQQGVVDGEDNSCDMAVFMKFTEVEKFFTNTNQTMQTNPTLIAKSSWDRLTDEQKKILKEAGEAADKFSEEDYKKGKLEGYRIAREQYKVEVIDKLAPEEKAAFRKAVEPVLAKYRKVIGEEFFDLFIRTAKKYEEK
jgi:tripartite ATP-independent transporter DctP family solute receptor